MDFEYNVLMENQWDLLKSLRLQSIHEDPSSFWEKLEDVESYKDEYWIDLASKMTKPDGSICFIAYANGEAIGVIYGIVKSEYEHRIGGLWVNTTYRGKSVASNLIQYVVNWAKGRNCDTEIKLWSPDNDTALFYKKNKFVLTGEVMTHPDDGRQVVHMKYKP